MNQTGLQLRMAVVGSVLFGLYLAAAWFFHLFFGVDLLLVVLLSIVLLPAGQYKLGKWLAIRSAGAQDMPEDHPQFRKVHQMTESLCRDMDMEKPRLMVAEMGVPNAFATGRKGAGIVVVSTELMQVLEDDELEGVIAHELAHLKNRDTVMMTLGQSIATIVGYAVFFFVQVLGEDNPGSFVVAWIASILANFLVMIFVMAISRYREYVADDTARRYIGSGDPLARALEKISRSAEGRESRIDDSGVNALCIFNADRSTLQRIFSTHPPTEKRIENLRR
ncbi:Zn-dependent protease with chaperone function [Halalkaliarchaeum sp. AArc-CO]|uniref:M48 family metallopeptidase n=1 Tax=Halalkaliarchaeum sp. AArc-CO TaxID=2866381 RepID=UPI00217E94C4|nr:M48 family metalloprotease [Halalkaliarchaeum sp. AArc-CO]UWG49630.1 Zn-dependent protease with chaperone function [Halalkaliarchaeum sp. AArc-CO]